MKRRTFLSVALAGTAAIFAGCIAERPEDKFCLHVEVLERPDGVILDSPTAAELEGDSPGVVNPIDEFVDDAARTVALAAIDEGEAVTAGIRPLDDGRHVRTDDAYYVLTREEVDSVDVERWVLSAQAVDDPTREPVDVRDLDDMLRGYLAQVARRANFVFREVHHDPTEIGLAPEPDPPYILSVPAPEEDPVPLELRADREPVEERRYRYTAIRLTTDPDAFVDDTIPTVDDLGLTDEQVEMFELAIDDAYDPEDGDGAFAALIDELRGRYVRHDGTVHRPHITHQPPGIDCPTEPS